MPENLSLFFLTGNIRALLRVLVQQVWLWALLSPAVILDLLGMEQAKQRVVQLYYRVNARIWGVTIVRQGSLSPSRPLLVVSNHTSYLDIIVLGSLGPMRFTPKSEIARWPLIGWIARLCGAIFIERKTAKAAQHRDVIRVALEHGHCVSIFPEGTTGEGERLLPFKSSLLAAVEAPLPGGEYIAVQPVALRYTHLDGKPITDKTRTQVAWIGEALFFPHAWNILRHRSVRVEAAFLAPIVAADCRDRKALAAHCEAQIAQALGADCIKKSP